MAFPLVRALVLAGWLTHSVQAVAKPLSIAATHLWEGVDGNWSTFWVQAGSRQQQIRVLPGTSASASTSMWLVLEQGCVAGISNCSSTRGSTFNANASSSWTTDGLPDGGLGNLNAIQEAKLGLAGSVQYGYDDIILGLYDSITPNLDQQLISGITTKNYWLGFVGLSPYSTNITGLDHSIPSLLSRLVTQKWIPSLSWGYTAGAYYYRPYGERTAYGSLTFGGYDANQWDPLTSLKMIPFSKDPSRDMVVQLTGLIKSAVGNTTLLTDPIDVYIDSTVTELWLPVEVCNNIETAFGLTYDENAQLYFVSESMRYELKQANTYLTFRIDSPNTLSLDFYFPYAAFDLVIQPPLVNKTAYYFPLKRATSPSQYTLGRVFLQEVYIVADYENGNFGIGRATHWQPDNKFNQALTAISPASASTSSTPDSGGGNGLGNGGIAAVVIIPVALVAAVVAAYIWNRKRRNRRRQEQYEAELHTRVRIPPPTYQDAVNADKAAAVELDGGERHELDRNERLPEMQGGRLAHQLDHGNERMPELQTGQEAHEMGRGNSVTSPNRPGE